MSLRDIELTLSPFEIADADEIEDVRLVVLGGAPQIATSATAAMAGRSTQFSTTPLRGGAGTSVLATIPQLLPVPPRWDLCPEERGAALLYDLAGGATNALYLAHIPLQTRPVWLTSSQRLESFSRARFVRGGRSVSTPGARPFTSVVDNQRLVAFPDTNGAAYTPLVAAEDGLLLRWARGFALVYKERRWGPVRGDSTSRGVVRCVQLGDDLRPLGQVVAPLGDALIFELDAEVRDGAIVVLATTVSGVALAWLRDERGALEVAARLEAPQKGELARPSILAEGAGFHVAAIDVEPKEEGRLWVGRVDLQGPP